MEDVAGNYARHANAARALAEEFLDAPLVGRRLLRDLGVTG